MNLNPGIAAVPIQAVAPTKKLAKKWAVKTNSSKFKKQPFIPHHRLSPKQCENKSSAPKKPKSLQTKSGANVEKKNPDILYEARFNFSEIPPPFCSCSGVARRCYKSGPGGWQSSCCTNTLSGYPLPFSPLNPAKRITGRKMNRGPYKKLLCTLAEEGHDLSRPVDLKDHWAKHGTNKFVTIK